MLSVLSARALSTLYESFARALDALDDFAEDYHLQLSARAVVENAGISGRNPGTLG